MTEILFVVSEAPEGGYVASGVDASIVTEADDLDQLRVMIRDADPHDPTLLAPGGRVCQSPQVERAVEVWTECRCSWPD